MVDFISMSNLVNSQIEKNIFEKILWLNSSYKDSIFLIRSLGLEAQY